MNAKKIHDNPTADELRAFTEEMSACRVTEFDNVNVQTRVVSRSTGSTYVVTEDPAATSQKAMPREEFDRIAKMQDEFIAQQEMVVVDGYIGNDESFRTRARLSIERANANVAGMQQIEHAVREHDPAARASLGGGEAGKVLGSQHGHDAPQDFSRYVTVGEKIHR